MTITAPTPTKVDPPRDRWGRYLIPDPETGKPTGYTRATTFAKSVSDTFGLTKWMLRMGGLGLAQRQDLLLAVASTDPGDNKTLDRLMEEAKDHAGAMAGATIGTALHTFTEQYDLGLNPVVPAPFDADVAAYAQAIVDADLTILPEHIEQIVVIPSLEVAGTLDRIVRTADGRLVIADLKTGKDVSYAMGEIAVQLALYAAAPWTFDPATGELNPMPVVDQETALVFHAPAGTGTCTVLEVDITAGRAMFDTITTVRGWRKRRDLHKPYISTPPAPVLPSGAESARFTWLVSAVTSLVEAGHAGVLAERWPVGCPTLRQAREEGVVLTASQCDTLHRVVMEIAGDVGHPFFAEAYPDDDALVLPSDPRVTDLKNRLGGLPVDLAETIHLAATSQGVPKLTSGHARRSDIDLVTRMVIDAEEHYQGRRARASNALATFPDEVQDVVLRLAGITGPVQLTAQAADRIDYLADAKELGALDVENGAVVLSADAFTNLLAAHGGSKRALLDVAKEAAQMCGLARPTSSTQVANDVTLFAATLMATNQ